ncbi:hypothetical protein [Cohnella luojiensis]|uniref:Uncharacterized protein n=1 Tax=Cohnella luojiensis TaxID=652876 RepID=A0A4Y8LUZ1_9BACL|nr:hypothetical protein [Cohnella luojiensis]TFE24882.1 hypothetical protein E2980_15170 [Cohnella luojiensis]
MGDPSGRDENFIAAPLPLSFKQIRLVTQDELTRRMEPVKVLKEDALELYRIVKDNETGEHYLHYAVFHVHVAGGGAEEEYHHLLPLTHDDVIALALGAPLFEYPSEWSQPYLRNGPHGGFVWYDPGGAADEEADYAETEAYIREQLSAFRRQGVQGEEEVRKLLENMDKNLPPRTDCT